MLAAARAEAQGVVYGIGGFGGYTGWFGGAGAYHIAGGGELLVKGIAGAGAEIGLLGNVGSPLTVLSFNGVAHVADRGDTTSPYVTGGYSRFSSGEGNFNAINFAIGVDFRANRRAGIRLEFRDHLRRDFRGSVHYYSIRAGIALR
jgi:hypothetical protein